MAEEVESVEKVGIFHLIRMMLSPRTLPHIFTIALLSGILMLFVKSYEVQTAYAFISLSVSYGLVAILANTQLINKLTTLPDEHSDLSFLVRIAASFRITIVPMLMAIILFGLMWTILGGAENSWIVPLLASLFILWSISQASSFRTGMVEWLGNGLGDARLHTYRERLSTASQIIIIQVFAFIIIWLGQMISSTEKMTFSDALIGGFVFLLIVGVTQFISLWLTKDEREAAGGEKGLAGFSFKWMIIAQLFITWHLFSVYRRIFMDPSTVSTMIEEGLLMAFTVLFAVWSLSTYTVSDGKRLVSENSALPLGIAFGYAYAGSVAMLSGTFESIKGVLIFGHLLSIATMIFLLKPTLRASRLTSDMVVDARNVDITKEDEDESEDEQETEDESEEVWQEDNEVDWEEGVDIGDGTEWDEESEENEASDKAES